MLLCKYLASMTFLGYFLPLELLRSGDFLFQNCMYSETNIYLSIVIPAYNEAERIGETLLEIDQYLRKKSLTMKLSSLTMVLRTPQSLW